MATPLVLGLLTPALLASSAQGRWRDGSPPARSSRLGVPRSSVGPRPGQQHLSEWLNQHRQLSPAEQQRALSREPGFRQLPAEVQQRMRNRLSQLDNMSPEKRQRILNRTEAMERLAPAQRQQIRSSMQQLSSLPPDQQPAVKQAFRRYRSLGPAQRQAALTSGALTNALSPEQRSTFNGLVAVEPLLPARPGPQQPAPQP